MQPEGSAPVLEQDRYGEFAGGSCYVCEEVDHAVASVSTVRLETAGAARPMAVAMA